MHKNNIVRRVFACDIGSTRLEDTTADSANFIGKSHSSLYALPQFASFQLLSIQN